MNYNILEYKYPDYSKLLTEIPDPPKILYGVGRGLTDVTNPVAIVGARKATKYGRDITYQLAYDLAKAGCTIISGLALGIDSMAHKGAIDAGGKTIAVLANGLDRIYPACHTQLAKEIINQGGAIVSENPKGTQTLKHHFLARNRIISGLAVGIIVTEAAQKSGSLTTARFALEQNRAVMSVPGNITSPLSAGANNLIRIGATLVSNSEDVTQTLGFSVANISKERAMADNPEEAMVIKLLIDQARDVDELSQLLESDITLVNNILTMLEIKGVVSCIGGGKWALR